MESVHSIESVESRYLNALNGQLHEIPSCLQVRSNDLDLFVRTKKQNLSGITIKSLLTVKTLTIYQKMTLLYKNYKLYQLVTRGPIKAVLYFLRDKSK